MALERPRDAHGNFLRGDRAAGAGDDHLGKPARVDADKLVRPDRFDHALGRHRAAGAEIGRAEDRHLGDGPGILDEIADPHDVAGHGDVGAERRLAILRGAAPAQSPASGSARARAMRKERIIAQAPLFHQLGGRLQHLVGRSDDLGIHLVGALRRDQVGNLGDRGDVRLFEAALQQGADADCGRNAIIRRCRTLALPRTGCRRWPASRRR